MGEMLLGVLAVWAVLRVMGYSSVDVARWLGRWYGLAKRQSSNTQVWGQWRKLQVPASRAPISRRTRFLVLKRDRYTCQYCGRKAPEVELEVDHRIPVAKGGSNNLSNLVTACRDCNRGKRDDRP